MASRRSSCGRSPAVAPGWLSFTSLSSHSASWPPAGAERPRTRAGAAAPREEREAAARPGGKNGRAIRQSAGPPWLRHDRATVDAQGVRRAVGVVEVVIGEPGMQRRRTWHVTAGEGWVAAGHDAEVAERVRELA